MNNVDKSAYMHNRLPGASRLGNGDRIERMKKREAFIYLKDHKENFENNPKCRLINPAKSESGKLSKVILDKINSN